jgi:hypothetical protein
VADEGEMMTTMRLEDQVSRDEGRQSSADASAEQTTVPPRRCPEPY